LFYSNEFFSININILHIFSNIYFISVKYLNAVNRHYASQLLCNSIREFLGLYLDCIEAKFLERMLSGVYLNSWCNGCCFCFFILRDNWFDFYCVWVFELGRQIRLMIRERRAKRIFLFLAMWIWLWSYSFLGFWGFSFEF
jgi:hypothetical protein